MYLLGSFTRESNYKPLDMIATKNLANAPPCLQRMLLEWSSNMGPDPRCNSLMHWASKSLTGDQAECKNWLHHLHKAMDWEAQRHNTERPHPGNSVPTHSARLATSKETCATCSKMILGLQRWTFYGWWTTSERTKAGDTTQTNLHCLYEGHLSTSKVQVNASQHMYWPGINADIEDYTKRCQEYTKQSQPAKEPF